MLRWLSNISVRMIAFVALILLSVEPCHASNSSRVPVATLHGGEIYVNSVGSDHTTLRIYIVEPGASEGGLDFDASTGRHRARWQAYTAPSSRTAIQARQLGR